MGKKIKGKKHRTVRYPEQQKRLRELKLYHKVNNPPKVIDDQEVPKSVRKIKEFKEKLQTIEAKYEKKREEKKNKKVQQKVKEEKMKSEKNNLLQRFLVQESGEETIVINDVRRLNKKKPAETFKQHMPVSKAPVYLQSKQSALLEEQTRQQKQRKLLSELSKEYPSLNLPESERKPKRKVNPNKRLNKREKDKLKQREKQNAKETEVDLSAPVYDKVEFGDIVHAPPKLLKRPRNTQVESKPGKKTQNLLLASMLNPNLPSSPSQPPRKFNYNPDLTGKRKALCVADRRRLDKEQASAIAAYKKLKADRWKVSQGT